jgi:ribosomal protein S18 acetylase RimI-like enzyme
MITIEDISRKHIRAFHKVLDSVSREKKYLAWTEAPPFGTFKALITNCIVNRSPQVLALDNGKVVGWCDITALAWPTTKHCGALGMGVLSAYRHQGIGTRLIDAALKKAKAYGLYRVELEVFEDNLPAIELYKKIGAVRIENKYINVLMMALFLRDYQANQEK